MAEGLKDDKYKDLISQGVRQGPEMDFLREKITSFIASQPAEEIYHGAQKIRLAWAVIRSPEENLEDERKRFSPKRYATHDLWTRGGEKNEFYLATQNSPEWA
jgi:hypothetical protein